MEWNHLPVPGGLYDQHPKLLDDWTIISNVVHNVEKQKTARDNAKANRKSGLGRGRRR